MTNLIINNQFGVTEKKGIPVVSSRYVAENFGKRHDHVLRDVGTIKNQVSEQFGLLNFGESSYRNEQNKRQPEYLMTRDGFSILVMGFTGKKAMQFKEAYINAFNQMESFIRDLLEAKTDFPEFTDAIMQAHEEPKTYHFSNECNMINGIVLGMSARKYKELNNIEAKSIRPFLSHSQIAAIKSLQRIDIGLIYTIPDYYQRKEMLEQQFNRLQQRALSA